MTTTSITLILETWTLQTKIVWKWTFISWTGPNQQHPSPPCRLYTFWWKLSAMEACICLSSFTIRVLNTILGNLVNLQEEQHLNFELFPIVFCKLCTNEASFSLCKLTILVNCLRIPYVKLTMKKEKRFHCRN